MRFGTELEGMERVRRVFDRLGEVPRDRGLFKAVGELIVEQAKRRFKTKRSPEGSAWKAWSDDYAATRGAGKSLLVDDGELRESIEARMIGQTLSIGSSVKYAMPAQAERPFMGMSADDASEALDLIEDRVRRRCGR